MTRCPFGLRTALGAALTVLAATCAAVAAVALPVGGGLPTSYGAVSPTAHVLGVVAGTSLLTAGCLAVWLGPSLGLGALLVAAGVLWGAPDAVGWDGGPPRVRAAGIALAPLLPVLLLGLLLATTARSSRRLGGVAAVGTAALAAAFVAVYDPFLDPDCWRTCSDTGVLVTARPGLADLLSALLALARTAVGVVSLALAAGQLSAASATARRRVGPLLAGVVAAGAAEAAYGVALLTRPDTPGDALLLAVHDVRAVAWTALAVAGAVTAQRALRRRRALRALAAELAAGPSTGSLAAAWRELTGDPRLEVLYPVGDDGRCVRADGTAPSPPHPGHVATPLRRDGQLLAVLVHEPDELPPAALEGLLGTAARLALENERLAAEQLARTVEVRTSRRRIVTVGDAARRRLERDLHDGAQQSLLALSYTLRLAAAAAERSGQPAVAAELHGAVSLASATLDELRELAHGIFPAVLSEAGLAVALRSLAERSAVPLELGTVAAGRCPASVELAVYAVVRAAAQDTGQEGLVVHAASADGSLSLIVDGYRGVLATDVDDRVAAVGGTARATPRGLEVVLPCE